LPSSGLPALQRHEADAVDLAKRGQRGKRYGTARIGGEARIAGPDKSDAPARQPIEPTAPRRDERGIGGKIWRR
jgi:hypothetical protein